MIILIDGVIKGNTVRLGSSILCDRCKRILPYLEPTIDKMVTPVAFYSPYLADISYTKNVVSGTDFWEHLCDLCVDQLDADNLWQLPDPNLVARLKIEGVKFLTVHDFE